jgi:elongator complex protein 4
VDSVITLRPFPHSFSVDAVDMDSSGSKGKAEEKMQGLIKVLKLPVLSEKGISVGVGEDMAFAVGRRRFLIRPFHLPPLETEDDQNGGGEGKGGDGKSLEF